ncbi:MAG: hypothetical protein WA159_10790 [Variovorax sp.]
MSEAERTSVAMQRLAPVLPGSFRQRLIRERQKIGFLLVHIHPSMISFCKPSLQSPISISV